MNDKRENENIPEILDDAKDVINDFINNLVTLVEGHYINSIIANAEDQETKSYIRLLPLFEDIREIIGYRYKTSRETNKRFEVSIYLDYISQEFLRKRNEIMFKLDLIDSDAKGYDIISSV